jgi:DNA helicase II / ATP-dependent DNA helicase PcrA
MNSSFLSGLNPEQLRAVTLPRESALVLAGAGSGKTRVLTTRIAHLIQSGQVNPGSVLAVTFTNKAAKEMLARITAMLPINPRGMWIGTFHGLCNRLLRAHHREARLPQLFQILDSQDQFAAIKRLLKTLNVDDEKFPPRELQYFINANKDEGRRPKDAEAYDDYTRRMVELYKAYDEQCQREGVVDFAELLLRSYELLLNDEILREHYRERFKFVLVDEFQDTNRLQYRWLKLLAGGGAEGRFASSGGGTIFAVGDDDQSIYAFRGAYAGNMHDFQREFAVKHLIKLEQNYRSHGNILDAANALIRNNRGRLGKELWTDAGAGEPIRVYAAPSDNEEAAFIVDEVKALRNDGWRLCDMALLYRSNAQSRVLEHALFSNTIPYRVYGGLRFFERMEVKHCLAYLRLAANQDDDGAFLRVVNFPPRGLGARSIEQLQEAAEKAGVSLMQTAIARNPLSVLNARASASLQGFAGIIERLKQSAASVPLPELVEEALELSQLRAHYQTEKEGADRVENLNEVVNAATAFTQEEEDSALVAFLTHASLEAGEHEAGEGADALQLMTVHSAKGLEFSAVFLSGLEEGLFPHENSASEAEGLEEERRLMYVAITRARKRLYASYAGSRMLHGQMRYGLPSRFLEEIPPQLCKLIQGELRAYEAPARSGTSGGTGWRTNEPRYGTRYNTTKATSKADTKVPQAMRAKLDYPFKIGQNVSHAKFGAGVVISFEGAGPDARVMVNFKQAGTKLLALEYAKLQAV